MVAAGLMPGERVAADGAFKLREGALVKTPEKQALSGQAGAAVGN